MVRQVIYLIRDDGIYSSIKRAVVPVVDVKTSMDRKLWYKGDRCFGSLPEAKTALRTHFDGMILEFKTAKKAVRSLKKSQIETLEVDDI